MGQPVTDAIHQENLNSAHGMGLDLTRGPDPRSYDPASRSFNREMRDRVYGVGQ